MQLNQSTGLDPDGVMLRASEGLAAVDFLMPRHALSPSNIICRAPSDLCQSQVLEPLPSPLSTRNPPGALKYEHAVKLCPSQL